MLIGVIKEQQDARVALSPEGVKKLLKAGFEVAVESGAGEKAFFSESAYEAVGAQLLTRKELLAKSGLILSIHPLDEKDLDQLSAGRLLIGLYNPLGNPELSDQMSARKLGVFSLDRVPRTTIAQSMDVLSSMASLAGYKAVLAGAYLLPRYFPMLMTAAGTIPPARVLVLGAGVAGLQAIATARRLGASVEAFDVRSEAKEEVLSLGAKFVEVEGATEDKEAGGYAVEQTEAYKERQRELIHERAAQSQVIITTANIPGRKAPLLIEARTVEAMQPGSVIVDLAAVTGGNCALTENGKTVVKHGVTIIGDSNLPGSLASDASRLYSNNLVNFLTYIAKEGIASIDYQNEIVAATYFGIAQNTPSNA